MRRLSIISGLTALLVLVGVVPARAQRGTVSATLSAGGLFPLGKWGQHRYAPNVNLVGVGPMFGLELEVGGGLLALAGRAEFAFNGTGEWEDYAASKGDRIEARMTTFQGLLLLRGRLWSSPHDQVRVGLGGGISVPSGEETFQGATYTYDFLKTGPGFAADVEADHALTGATSLVLRAGMLLTPKGIRYADGLKRDVTTLGLTLGVRFHS
jgi:hypothetical protein